MGNRITKAIVLAAGKGKRLYPLTHSIPKEMIRVREKPVIQHLIEAISMAGINEIQLVLSAKKESIITHFGSGDWMGIDVSYRIQEKPVGTADAVRRCKGFVGDEPFLVAYGDTYPTSKEMVDNFVKKYQDVHDALVALQWMNDFTGRGIVKLGNSKEIIELVEKPDETQALRFKQRCGYLAIVGIFILKPNMFKYIEDTTPGVNNETWLTDSLRLALNDGMKECGYICKNRVIDIGSSQSLKESRTQ